ncbi:MAG: hypothetical protein AAB870_05325 [Patescibacteria group bacterium]
MNEEILAINEKIAKRKIFCDQHEEAASKDIEIEVQIPNEVFEIGNDIYKDLRQHFDNLPVDFIIETTTKLGAAPNVLYDDNGHFCIGGDGFGPVASGDHKIEGMVGGILVESKMWKPTIREALRVYLFSNEDSEENNE